MQQADDLYQKTPRLRKIFLNCWRLYMIFLTIYCLLINVNESLAEKVGLSISRYFQWLPNIGFQLGLFSGAWPKAIYTTLMVVTLIFGLIAGLLSILIEGLPYKFNPVNYGEYLRARNQGFYTLPLFFSRVFLLILGLFCGFVLWFSFLNSIPITVNTSGWAWVYSFLIFLSFPSFIISCLISFYLYAYDFFNFFNLIARHKSRRIGD